VTPTWEQKEEGLARFTLEAAGAGGSQIAETAGYASARDPAGIARFKHAFTFLDVPKWGASTPASDVVLVDGVHCSKYNYRFRAYGALAPLRLTLDYTPLRPKDAEAFLMDVSDTAPLLDEVKRKTVALEQMNFLAAAQLDSPVPGGGYSLGAPHHTLSLPGTLEPSVKYTKAQIKWDSDSSTWTTTSESLGIRDNSLAPSALVFQTTMAQNNTVQGVLSWNVSRGWEGYAYRVCVTARPLPLSAITSASSDTSATDDPSIFQLFAKKCMYIVVPKCVRCHGRGDNLDAIAQDYGARWLDLWSVNLELINTTVPDPTKDEVFNTARDLHYPLIPAGIRLD
jgi:hypothetical protein